MKIKLKKFGMLLYQVKIKKLNYEKQMEHEVCLVSKAKL